MLITTHYKYIPYSDYIYLCDLKNSIPLTSKYIDLILITKNIDVNLLIYLLERRSPTPLDAGVYDVIYHKLPNKDIFYKFFHADSLKLLFFTDDYWYTFTYNNGFELEIRPYVNVTTEWDTYTMAVPWYTVRSNSIKSFIDLVPEISKLMVPCRVRSSMHPYGKLAAELIQHSSDNGGVVNMQHSLKTHLL